MAPESESCLNMLNIRVIENNRFPMKKLLVSKKEKVYHCELSTPASLMTIRPLNMIHGRHRYSNIVLWPSLVKNGRFL